MSGLLAPGAGQHSSAGCSIQQQRACLLASAKCSSCGHSQRRAHLHMRAAGPHSRSSGGLSPLPTSSACHRRMQAASRCGDRRWRGGAATCASALGEGARGPARPPSTQQPDGSHAGDAVEPQSRREEAEHSSLTCWQGSMRVLQTVARPLMTCSDKHEWLGISSSRKQ